MAHLGLALLGPFRAVVDGEPASGFASVKVRALLAYLAVETDRPHPRDTLVGLLWPDWPDGHALSNLRHALSNLRATLRESAAPAPFVLASREAVQWNSAAQADVDVLAFRREVSEAGRLPAEQALPRLERAVALYRGPFLEGLAVPDSAPFEQWLTLQREHWQREVLGALGQLAGLYEGRREYAQAQGCARKALALEPTDERWQRQLMRTLALGGERSAALAQYEACRRVLREELGVEPTAETAALYEAIRQGTLGSPLHGGPMHELALRPRVAEAPVEEEQVPEPIRPLFVARQQELARLEGWLEEALRGQGRVGFVVGEPGSGKTMLLREFGWRAMEAHPELIAARGACNATSGVGDPYLPFLEILQTLLGDIEARRVVGGITHEHARRLQGATPDALGAVLQAGPVLVDTLLPGAMLLERARSLADADAWVAKVQGAIEHRPGIPSQTYLFEQVTRVLQGLAKGRPLLLLLDDLQWSDVASIGLLFHLGRRLAGHRVLVLAAYRPEEVAAGREGQPHPLQPVVLEFQRAWGAVQVDLAQAQGRALVDALVDSEPNRLDPAFREALYKHTDGQALFSAELLRGLQERGDLIREPDGRWIEGATLDWDQLPGRVEAAIAAHMARLPREEQELLSVASVEGEEFHAEVVAQVMGIGEREAATRLSGALAKQHRLVVPVSLERQGEQRLSRYRFRHYLFQQHLYQGLDLVERARLHEEVGNTLETLYGGRLYEDAAAYMVDHWRAVWIDGAPSAPLGNAQIAPQLARHFEIAGLVDRAVLYLYLAASRAWVRSAPNEALVHLIAAVSCLQQMPNAPQRAKQEFAIQFILHFAHMFQTMWAAREAGSAAERALELARQIGEPFWIVLGLYLVGEHDQSARLATSEELLGEALEQAQQAAPALLPALRCNLGFTLYFRGQFRRASQPWEEFLAPFFAAREPTIDELTQIEPQFWACMAPYVWALGYPDLASRVSQTAFGLVERGNYWLASMVALLDGGVIFHHMRHEMQAALDRAAELLALNQEVQSPSFSAPLAVYRGWALAQSGRVEEGIASMRQGLADFRAEGDQTRVPHFLALLAEGYLAAGRAEEGLAPIAEALEIAERTDERYYEAEIHRIHGELLLLCGADPEDVEEAYRRSVAVAQGQEAKSFELRSTMSLAKLLRGQGRAAEAREMLAAIYGWFTEGFDTPDLVEAKGLLEQLKT